MARKQSLLTLLQRSEKSWLVDQFVVLPHLTSRGEDTKNRAAFTVAQLKVYKVRRGYGALHVRSIEVNR